MRVSAFVLIALATAATPALAAGGGAGAGGAGSQRAINSGLPAGEAGPTGAPNNRGGPRSDPSPIRGVPHAETPGDDKPRR